MTGASARSIAPVLAAVALVAAGMFVRVGAQPAHADDFVPVGLGGFVFEDRNGDGIYDPMNDNPLDSWIMDLSDGDQIVAQTFTWGGSYAFSGVGAGTFYVFPDPFANWISTPDSHAVTTSSGVNVGNLDFAVFQAGYVQGQVFQDMTGNGFSADDRPMDIPVQIDLYVDGNPMPLATTTAQYGRYVFNPLGAGIYTVKERVPAGYTLTAEVGATTYGYSGFRSDGNDFDNFPLFGVYMLAVKPVEGAPFMGAVARLTPGDPTSVGGDFTATIDWGDGVASAGSVASDPNGGFLVNGSHSYAEEGAYTLAASVTKIGGSTAAGSESVTVRDAAPHALGQSLSTSRSTTFSGVVSTFTDDDPNGVVADYSATIDWGDGTSSLGTVSVGPGGFGVSGGHTFVQGWFTITTSVTDQGGASTSATSTITIDWTPPTTTASVTSNLLTLNAVDNLTGVQTTYYTVNGGSAQPYAGPVTLKNGKYTIQYWSIDGAGNTESPHSVQIKGNHG